MKINPKLKRVALSAAKKAGEIIRKNFQKKIEIRRKGDKTPVTSADIKADRLICSIIRKSFPNHNIVSEEGGGTMGKNYTWVIDPLDGTKNFIAGWPFFSVSIALVYGEDLILGVVFNPITEKLYFAEKGKGAYLNGGKIKVNSFQDFSLMNFGFSKGGDLEGGVKILKKLTPFIQTFRYFGSDNLFLCSIAEGKIEGFFNLKSEYYDVAAGLLIVQEAGGKVTDFNNKKYLASSKSLIVSNGKIHDKLLKLINN
jgi:myo-inositol-1(or 4)-monophosphatase